MHHDVPLISTIAVGLAYALAGGFIAARLKLPPLIGYLLAGVAVGPFTPGFVADTKLAPQLAEIGVILLMFGVGMHFSLRDLMKVRAIAIPGAVVQIAVATAMGTGLALVWNWTLGGGLVLGLALSVASTVVLLRALEKEGRVESEDGRVAVGWLIVEDLVMVLVLVLLPALAVPLGGQLPGGAHAPQGSLGVTIALTLGKVAAFVAMMLLAGKRVLPWVIRQVEATGSRELFTLAVAAIALAVAYVSATLFGVSFALGAFFAGVVVNESNAGHAAEKDLKPLQDIFAVLFFVSVGMLFDPSILTREPLRVALVVAVIVLGKSVAAYFLVLAFGRGQRTAVTVAAGLAQIGEFSFILAGLGVSLQLLPAEGRDLILAGALFSITLNPFLFRLVQQREQTALPA